MGKREIERKFDEIVAFAELQKFIDTPVKHYSSGMYVRLAFAVAAHLEPEILLVDEVLAVGDINFQKKCMGKMGDVSKAGRTVILVSHNMGAIGQLCHRCVWLDKGDIASDGPTDATIAQYVKGMTGTTHGGGWERTGSGRAQFNSVEFLDASGMPCPSIAMGQDAYVRITGKAEKAGIEFSLALQFATANGTIALYIYDQFKTFRSNSDREFWVEVRVPKLMLMPGSYFLHAWAGKSGQEEFDYVRNAASIEVIQSDRVPVTHAIQNQMGLVYCDLEATQLG
jgi:lipopolysaccharide transport system ATP-binding protein